MFGVIGLPLTAHPARAVGTIYIREDGSIEPPTANITSTNNIIYTFTSNLQDSIVVERDDVVVNGAGYSMQGSGFGEAIRMNARRNVTLSNMKITNFTEGLRIDDSSTYITIHNISLVRQLIGMTLYAPTHVTISSCLVMNCMLVGISLLAPNYVTITQTTLMDNYIALSLDVGVIPEVEGNYIFHNNFINNYMDIGSFTWCFFDDGYPSGGNYWDTYNGTDLFSGPYQNESGCDGIGDTPYPVGLGSTEDRYPLVQPFSWWDYADLNHDFIVDIYDLVTTASAYGSTPADPNWNILCDIAEPYGIINIFDIVTIAASYGEEYTPLSTVSCTVQLSLPGRLESISS